MAQALDMALDALSILRVGDTARGIEFDIAVLREPRRRDARVRGADVLSFEWRTLGAETSGERVASVDDARSESGVLHVHSGEHVAVGAGVYQLASVGGYVFIDSNANGRWDRSGELDEQSAPKTPVELRVSWLCSAFADSFVGSPALAALERQSRGGARRHGCNGPLRFSRLAARQLLRALWQMRGLPFLAQIGGQLRVKADQKK